MEARSAGAALPLGIQVATAGFVLGRLLLKPPAAALVESLNDPAMRATWPLADEDTRAALAALDGGAGELGAVRFDYERLFVRASPGRIELRTGQGADDHVGQRILDLAELTATAAQAERSGDGAAAAAARESATRLREKLDPVVGLVLDAVQERAVTPLFRVLPGLVRGFLVEELRSR